MTWYPDPLRDHFIRGARRLLDRAYAAPGTWQGTRLAGPDAAALRFCARHGIDPYGPDNASATGGRGRRAGGLNARTRWMRAFVRCLYEQHLWWAETHSGDGWRDERRLARLGSRSLRVEVGRALPARGVIPAGRAIRIQVTRTGREEGRAAALRKPERDQIYDDHDQPADRWSDPDLRDW